MAIVSGVNLAGVLHDAGADLEALWREGEVWEMGYHSPPERGLGVGLLTRKKFT